MSERDSCKKSVVDHSVRGGGSEVRGDVTHTPTQET